MYIYICIQRESDTDKLTNSERKSEREYYGAMVHHLGLRVSHARPVELIVARLVLSSGAVTCPKSESLEL